MTGTDSPGATAPASANVMSDVVSRPSRSKQIARTPYGPLSGMSWVFSSTATIRPSTSAASVTSEFPEARVLRQELSNFRAKISLSGHDSYGESEDWREGHNDDTVLATACAVWYGEHLTATRPRELDPRLVEAFRATPGPSWGRRR